MSEYQQPQAGWEWSQTESWWHSEYAQALEQDAKQASHNNQITDQMQHDFDRVFLQAIKES
ncbi:hypothetical protein [Shewanella phage vB_SbaS_Y11]|nr:hypothetical protein [Shewanella phage vB_SbaS_Y11]